MTLSKYYPLNSISDVLEPRYSTKDVIIAKDKIRRSKLNIRLRFSGVNPTSEYAGDWFITKQKALRGKHFDNNGLPCFAIPMSEFEPLTISQKEYA